MFYLTSCLVHWVCVHSGSLATPTLPRRLLISLEATDSSPLVITIPSAGSYFAIEQTTARPTRHRITNLESAPEWAGLQALQCALLDNMLTLTSTATLSCSYAYRAFPCHGSAHTGGPRPPSSIIARPLCLLSSHTQLSSTRSCARGSRPA